MKRITILIACLVFITGCGNKDEKLENKIDEIITTKVVENMSVNVNEEVNDSTIEVMENDQEIVEEPTTEVTTTTVTTTTTTTQSTTTTTKKITTTTTTKTTVKSTTKATDPITTDLTEAKAYEILMSLQSEYPEGTPWNDNSYSSFHGGNYSGGWGCVGFAYMASDRVFGTLPVKRITDFSKVRVGDIFRYNTPSYGHSVVVLEVKSDRIVVVEGNWQKKVHWFREITFDYMKSNGVYIYTRWP